MWESGLDLVAQQTTLSEQREPHPSPTLTGIALMMEAVRTSETSINIYKTTRRNVLEGCRENLKSLDWKLSSRSNTAIPGRENLKALDWKLSLRSNTAIPGSNPARSVDESSRFTVLSYPGLGKSSAMGPFSSQLTGPTKFREVHFTISQS
jgi:hypothetical protein